VLINGISSIIMKRMNKDLVLMFHEVHDRLWFEKTLLYLGRRYRFIDFDGISSRIKNGSYDYPVIHITFDDGHKSFYEVAFPILCKHNIPATGAFCFTLGCCG